MKRKKIKKITLKIKDNRIIRNTEIKKKFFVSSNTKNGFFIQKSKLIKKANAKEKLYKINCVLFNFFKFFSIIKHKKGKIIKPNGKKKYGGNNIDVRKPSIKKIKIFNYFFLFQRFQFFYYLI